MDPRVAEEFRLSEGSRNRPIDRLLKACQAVVSSTDRYSSDRHDDYFLKAKDPAEVMPADFPPKTIAALVFEIRNFVNLFLGEHPYFNADLTGHTTTRKSPIAFRVGEVLKSLEQPDRGADTWRDTSNRRILYTATVLGYERPEVSIRSRAQHLAVLLYLLSERPVAFTVVAQLTTLC